MAKSAAVQASNPTDSRRVLRIDPNPGQQVKALAAEEFEVLFGGSAGPGKTWVLVVDALGAQFQFTPFGKPAFMHPDYRAVVFRRTSKQLTKLLDEARKIYPHLGGVYAGTRIGEPGPCYTFYDAQGNQGGKIFFCHLETENDKESHQGQEYQFVGFDELTHFTLTQYLYLFSRTRSTIPGITPRIRSTTNPAGSGLWWVKKRFITNLRFEQTHYFLADKEPERNPQGIRVPKGTKHSIARRFIPGKLQENAHLIDNDPEYISRIMAMGSTMERALLHGDWDAFGGDFLAEFDRSTMVVEPFEVPRHWKIFGSLDPGYSHPCSFGLWAVDPEFTLHRLFTYYESKRNPEKNIAAIVDEIKAFKWTDGRMPEVVISGHDAWAKRDQYAMLATDRTWDDIAREHGLILEKAIIDRIPGWWALRNTISRGNLKVFAGFNEPLLDEISAAVADEKQPEDIAGRGNDPSVMDHALDETRGFNMSVFKPDRPAKALTAADKARLRSIDSRSTLQLDRREDW